MSAHKPKMKNIKKEIIDELVQHHIPYELWMMRTALAAAIKGSWSRLEQNKNVEVFALHARNLIEFLKDADACAFDPAYFTKENSFKVNKKFIKRTLIDMINEQISHLTDGRKRHEGKLDEPQWREIDAAIKAEFDRWVNNLSEEWAEKWENRERPDETDGKTTIQEGYAKGATNSVTSVRNDERTTGHDRGQ